MSRSRAFLTGHLSGLLLGSLVIGISFASSAESTINQPPIVPVRSAKISQDDRIWQRLPEGWSGGMFNGQPYYIIPLVQDPQ